MSVLLAQNIKWGRWAGELPGIRTLCEEMEVSRQTMMVAIRHLEADGLVEPAEKGKPRKIVLQSHSVDQGLSIPQSTRVKKIVCLSHQPSEELPHVDRSTLQQLEKGISKRGYHYEHAIVADIHAAQNTRTLKAVTQAHPADIYMVLGANAESRKWLDNQSTPVIYVGGYSSNSKFPSVAFSFSDRCRIALKEVVSWGHKRAVLFLPTFMQGNGNQTSEVERLIYQLYDSFSLQCSAFNIPRWGKTSDELYLTFERTFMLTPPTAIVLADASMVPTLMSFLIQKKIKYPEDLSIVCMDDHPLLSHFRPPITHMIKSTSQLVEKILTIIDGIDVTELPSGEQGIRVALQRTSSISKPKAK